MEKDPEPEPTRIQPTVAEDAESTGIDAAAPDGAESAAADAAPDDTESAAAHPAADDTASTGADAATPGEAASADSAAPGDDAADGATVSPDDTDTLDHTRVLFPDAETTMLGPVAPAAAGTTTAAPTLPAPERLQDLPPERDPDATRWWAVVLALPVGAIGAVLGLVPWLLTGGQLPVQDLWAAETRPSAMPFVLLPFSQFWVIQIFSLLIVGAALAGIGGRALRLRGWGLTLLELGVLGVQGVAVVQTAMVLRDGLQDRFESAMYLAGLLIGAVLSVLIGILVTLLVAAAPRAGALLGLTAGAIGATAWLGLLLFPSGGVSGPFADLAAVLPWVTPVLTGLAIVWAGVNSVGRVLSALVALAMIWVAPAVTTAVASTLGSRVLLRSVSDMVDYGRAVFESVLLTPEVALRPVIAAAVVATIGLLLRWLVTRLVKGGTTADE